MHAEIVDGQVVVIFDNLEESERYEGMTIDQILRHKNTPRSKKRRDKEISQGRARNRRIKSGRDFIKLGKYE